MAPPTTPGVPLDKLFHLCEYLLFAWCIAQAGHASHWPAWKIRMAALVWPVTWGLLLEGVQSLLPYRSAEWADVVANALGAGLGVWITSNRQG